MTLSLSDDLLYDVGELLARKVHGLAQSRRLATVCSCRPPVATDYRTHASIRATLRQLERGTWQRATVLGAMKRAIRAERLLHGYANWLEAVRATDREQGVATIYRPNQPGQFLP
jgi:hypothetical protein